ncbi:MAG: chemotaxis protein CheW [Lysobacterales bacterium]
MQTANAEISEMSIQEMGEQYLTFVLNNEEYAIEILKVQEIKSWAPVTPIPCSPDYLLGVINLRGAIVPVVDLRQKFGMEPRDFTPVTAVIIVRATDSEQQRVAGLVVDQVEEVYHLQAGQIQDSAGIAASIDSKFISSLAQIDDKLVILINLESIIDSSLELMNLSDAVKPADQIAS